MDERGCVFIRQRLGHERVKEAGASATKGGLGAMLQAEKAANGVAIPNPSNT